MKKHKPDVKLSDKERLVTLCRRYGLPCRPSRIRRLLRAINKAEVTS
jgi:hypothetical protein